MSEFLQMSLFKVKNPTGTHNVSATAAEELAAIAPKSSHIYHPKTKKWLSLTEFYPDQYEPDLGYIWFGGGSYSWYWIQNRNLERCPGPFDYIGPNFMSESMTFDNIVEEIAANPTAIHLLSPHNHQNWQQWLHNKAVYEAVRKATDSDLPKGDFDKKNATFAKYIPPPPKRPRFYHAWGDGPEPQQEYPEKIQRPVYQELAAQIKNALSTTGSFYWPNIGHISLNRTDTRTTIALTSSSLLKKAVNSKKLNPENIPGEKNPMTTVGYWHNRAKSTSPVFNTLSRQRQLSVIIAEKSGQPLHLTHAVLCELQKNIYQSLHDNQCIEIPHIGQFYTTQRRQKGSNRKTMQILRFTAKAHLKVWKK